jgi:hypothetical protein
MALVAACRVGLAVNLVSREIISAVYKFAVGTIAVFRRRLHGFPGGMAVVAERPLMTDGAELVILSGIILVVKDEIRGMVEGGVWLENPLDLVFMAFGTAYSSLFQRLGV